MRICTACGRPAEPGWTCSRCGRPDPAGEIPCLAPELLFGAGGDFPADAYSDGGAFERSNAFWYRPRTRLVSWALERYFPGAQSFLDSGCGSGAVLAGIRAVNPEIALTGVDASIEALDVARRRVEGLEVVQASALHLPYRDHFDAAGSFDVIEHLDDDLGAVRELTATVRPGGGVIIAVPQHPGLWSAYDDSGGHKRRYRRRGMMALLRAAGLEPLRVTSYVFTLLPLVAATRRRPLPQDGSWESPGPVTARVLEAILSAEVSGIRRGLSYPAGSSLFVIARKPAS